MKLSKILPLIAVSFSLVLTAKAQIVLNEILADNQTILANRAGNFTDWVELYNAGSSSRNIAGFSLSDERLKPTKFVFPPDTVIPSGGYLLVWFDDDLTAQGIHTGFNLDADGQTLWLYNASGNAIDSLTFGLQLTDFSIGRVPDGTGTWQLNIPSPRAANQAQPLGAISTLKLNEWMAVNLPDDDWFEIFNPDNLPVSLGGLILSDRTSNPTNRPVPALSFIEGNGFRRFEADDDPNKGANHVDFKLSSSNGDTITIYSASRNNLNRVNFGPQQQGVSQGRLPDGSASIVFFPTTSTPGESNFLPINNAIINEVLTHTDPPREDAVELYNPTAQPVNIGGWFISNSKADLKKFRIPDGTILPALGYKVFYEFQFDPNDQGFTFNSAHGDNIYLSQADTSGKLTGFRIHEDLLAAPNGVSLGRYVKSTGKTDFVPLERTTFGADNAGTLAGFRTGTGESNAPPKIGPLVLNEIMYHPRDILVGTNLTDNTADEFVEVYNFTGQTVLLYDPEASTNTWRIRGGIDFNFPRGNELGPRSYFLLVNFDPATNAANVANFRTRFGVPAEVKIFGPYEGKLNNGGDTVALLKPDPPQLPPHPDAGFVPYIRVDRVTYDRDPPWPATADGTGASLQRKNPRDYGNDVKNWSAAAPTGGRANGGTGELLITEPVVTGNLFTIGFAVDAGKSYSVQYRNSLSEGGWLSLTNIAGQSTSRAVQVQDAIAEGNGARFYRVVTPAQ